ncbi:hypothetical protein D9757_003960 [Collybiopsis confluens]|uniref:SWIM-type domain-containing protein n=1 Tax=Collybiopsis confluens TaxID=2823264 RepID=A0A8H5HWY9_9AGAR|nr:hypothetical protein D9757_003960 [Collybiopsis confluens]
MTNDQLAQFNGVKPDYLLTEGEAKEVQSKTSDAKYTVKRTAEHFYCTCPAWRNQSGVPVNARSCKHLLSLLGEAYEEARLQAKNPGGPPPKGLPGRKVNKSQVKGKAPKPVSKEADNDRMDMDTSEEGETKRKPASKSKPSSARNKAASKWKRTVEESEEDEEDIKSKKSSSPKAKRPRIKRRKDASDDDDSDNEEEEKPRIKAKGKKPSSTNGKTPIKRSRKDVSESEGEHENEGSRSKKTSTSRPGKPASKPVSKRRKVEEEAEEARPKKPSSSRRKTKRRRRKEEEEAEEEMSQLEDEEEDDENEGDGDELASIKGIKPLVLLQDGQEKEVQSQTSSSTYKIKRTFDHYYCTCPAWRNQAAVPVNARSCKHLIALLGEKYEAARIKLKNPDGAALGSPKKKASKGKKAKGDGNDATADVNVLLANSWDVDKGPDPTGWWISEKLDGVRTYYDGKQMYSRLGNPFTPPQSFLDKLPKDCTLDGELFGGRGKFQETVSIVKTMNSPHWKDITFHVFDMPSIGTQPFEARVERLKKLFGPGGSHVSDKVVVVEQEMAKGRQHVLDKLKEIETLSGEGLMLRKPGSEYEGKRSKAIVTGYKPGKGRNAGVTGALKCKMASGKTFDVGSGLNDQQRKKPPKIGSIIVYRFQELTKDGVPRFPTFLGEAADKTKPKDATVPDHRKGGAGKMDE